MSTYITLPNLSEFKTKYDEKVASQIEASKNDFIVTFMPITNSDSDGNSVIERYVCDKAFAEILAAKNGGKNIIGKISQNLSLYGGEIQYQNIATHIIVSLYNSAFYFNDAINLDENDVSENYSLMINIDVNNNVTNNINIIDTLPTSSDLTINYDGTTYTTSATYTYFLTAQGLRLKQNGITKGIYYRTHLETPSITTPSTVIFRNIYNEDYFKIDIAADKTFTITYKNPTYEEISNKVTSLTAASTDVQYPSAKSVYTALNATTKITPILTTGTHIADISVDGTSKALYAPNSGSGGGSTLGVCNIILKTGIKNIAANTAVDVQFDSFTNSANWIETVSTSTNNITIVNSGFITINGIVNIEGNSNGTNYFDLYLNNVLKTECMSFRASASYVYSTIPVSSSFAVTAGDIISFKVNSNAVSNNLGAEIISYSNLTLIKYI